MFPVCFPHEMLGYERGNVRGILLSIMIAGKIAKEDNSQGTSAGKRSGRFSKWKQNKGGGDR